jgi:hypothetical protein
MTASNGRAQRHPRSMSIWSMEDIRTLRYLVEQGLPPKEIALALGRSEVAIRNKALMQGISLRRATRGGSPPRVVSSLTRI